MKNLTEIIRIALVMLPLTSAAQLLDTVVVPPRIEYKKPVPICYTVDVDGTLIRIDCQTILFAKKENDEN